MKQNEFIELVKNPYQSSSSDLNKLLDLKKQFPFFQSAHLLLSLVSKKYDSGLYQQTLKQTAISIPNRARLHELLNHPIEKPVELNVQIQEIKETKTDKPVEAVSEKQTTEIEHLKAIEISSEISKEEELNKQVEREVEKDVVNAFVEKQVLKTNDWYKKNEAKQTEEKKEEVKQEKQEELKSGSFTDWLQALKKVDRHEEVFKPIENEKSEEEVKNEVPKKQTKKLKQQAIIDKIIEVNPDKIRLDPNQRFYAADIKAKESLIESEDLVTETLAKIYALQGNISKAIRAYEILSLKFPQKSAYFATLIQNLKKENK